MRVLFIGNSHTYVNDLPRQVQKLAQAAGLQMDVTMLTTPGQSLRWHAAQPETRFNLLYGNYDAVVLQDVAHPFAGYEALEEGIEGLLPYLSETHARVCLYMTWCEQRFPENQARMTAAYRRAGEKYGFSVAPVGESWQPSYYGPDGEHASPAGTFHAARVIARTLFGV